MTKFELTYPPGATPLDPDEQAGLIPDYITTHAELNELEQKNIQDSVLWLRSRRSVELLDSSFVYELHKRMFNQVWKWAGQTRKSGKNIGIDWTQISTQVALLLADARFWLEQKTFPADELAARFHLRLVHIHAFPNGNGRHARLMTDLLLEQMGNEPFSWGMKSSPTPIEAEGERRREYIAALQLADIGDYAPLVSFARS